MHQLVKYILSYMLNWSSDLATKVHHFGPCFIQGPCITVEWFYLIKSLLIGPILHEHGTSIISCALAVQEFCVRNKHVRWSVWWCIYLVDFDFHWLHIIFRFGLIGKHVLRIFFFSSGSLITNWCNTFFRLSRENIDTCTDNFNATQIAIKTIFSNFTFLVVNLPHPLDSRMSTWIFVGPYHSVVLTIQCAFPFLFLCIIIRN
jgi:hypothetical protein